MVSAARLAAPAGPLELEALGTSRPKVGLRIALRTSRLYLCAEPLGGWRREEVRAAPADLL